jgi:hypothetical protein
MLCYNVYRKLRKEVTTMKKKVDWVGIIMMSIVALCVVALVACIVGLVVCAIRGDVAGANAAENAANAAFNACRVVGL